MTTAALSEPIVVRLKRRNEQFHEWDRAWFRLRLPLLVFSFLALYLAYRVLPHRGSDPTASRYQTLTITIQSAGKAAGAYSAFTNLQYLNVSYEDPGIYWLINHIIAIGKIFNPSWRPSEEIIYPTQFCIFALALLLLSWKTIPLNVFVSAVVIFFLGFRYSLFYWSWDVYWAPGLAVLVCLAFLLSVTEWQERPLRTMTVGIMLGLFVGLLGLIRQDSGLIAQASAGAALLCLLFYWFVPRSHNNKLHARVVLCIACFTIAASLPRIVFTYEVKLIEWITPARVVGNLQHGLWHNLYLGIGFNVPPYGAASNIYGIKWDDSIGALHAVEQNPNGRFGTPQYMATLRTLIWKVFRDDTVFYTETVFARTYDELSLIAAAARNSVFWPALYLWPLLSLMLFVRSDRRAFDGVIYPIAALTALVPPVLTFPSPAYSTALGIVVLGCPIFCLGSFAEPANKSVQFPVSASRLLLVMVVALGLVAATSLTVFAVEGRSSNSQLIWNLLGDAKTIEAQLTKDTWRFDRHFNYSLSPAQRDSATSRLQEYFIGRNSNISVDYFPDPPIRVLSGARLEGAIVFVVETTSTLNDNLFSLTPDTSNHVFYRKALNWSGSQKYVLVFNTGDVHEITNSFTLRFANISDAFPPRKEVPVAHITIAPMQGR